MRPNLLISLQKEDLRLRLSKNITTHTDEIGPAAPPVVTILCVTTGPRPDFFQFTLRPILFWYISVLVDSGWYFLVHFGSVWYLLVILYNGINVLCKCMNAPIQRLLPHSVSPCHLFPMVFVAQFLCKNLPKQHLINHKISSQVDVCNEVIEEVCEDKEEEKCSIVTNEECKTVNDEARDNFFSPNFDLLSMFCH